MAYVLGGGNGEELGFERLQTLHFAQCMKALAWSI